MSIEQAVKEAVMEAIAEAGKGEVEQLGEIVREAVKAELYATAEKQKEGLLRLLKAA